MVDETRKKNESEHLFEQYLTEQGIQGWEYEPEIEGKTRHPDYRIPFREQSLFFEVKEFQPTAEEFSNAVMAYDPYPAIRQKINAARQQFQEYKEFSCSLVLRKARLVDLDVPWIVQGAMLGDFGLQLSVDPALGMAVGEPKLTFLKRGKMIDYKRMRPQNTTINALVVLERFPVGQRRVTIETARREKELGRSMPVEEFLAFLETLQANGVDIGQTATRVVVHENPFARIPLPRPIFAGPYDERFGREDDRITRVFAGAEIERFEAEGGRLK